MGGTTTPMFHLITVKNTQYVTSGSFTNVRSGRFPRCLWIQYRETHFVWCNRTPKSCIHGLIVKINKLRIRTHSAFYSIIIILYIINFSHVINNISTPCDNGLIINDLPDHLPIFTLCYTDAHSSTIKPKESVAIRNFSSQNINAFNNLLCEFDWNSLIYADANAACNGFIQKYTEFYNKSFPIKFCQEKNLKTLHNPLVTTGILKSIKTKSRLYKLFLRKPNHERNLSCSCRQEKWLWQQIG